jgi:hypothetical protein
VGADDEVAGGDQVNGGDETTVQSGFRYHRRHGGRDGGSVAGSPGGGTAGATGAGTAGSSGATARDAGTGPVTDCEICTTAAQCCTAVEARQCSFSAAACDSMVGDARPAYINACLVYVMSVRGVWGGAPPAECL